MNDTKISIVVPTLNEEPYVEGLIHTFLSSCPQPSELFFADAGSSDATVEIVRKWCGLYPNIKLVVNERRYVSNAFNTCYQQSTGKYLALLGAHSKYPPEFFKVAYDTLERDECDAVGGPLIHKGRSPLGEAVAYCMSTRFGVGGTEFRVSKKRMFVDSVAFAFYKREVFQTVGLFDEDLVRNQDDEMHYRINAAGYRMLMEPAMSTTYYVRESLKALIRQYYQYGLFKPLVLRKVRSGLRIRHLIPSAFVLYLSSLPVFLFTFLGTPSLIPLAIYLVILGYYAFASPVKPSSKFWVPLVYPALHISYGLGFILGLRKLFSKSSSNAGESRKQV